MANGDDTESVENTLIGTSRRRSGNPRCWRRFIPRQARLRAVSAAASRRVLDSIWPSISPLRRSKSILYRQSNTDA